MSASIDAQVRNLPRPLVTPPKEQRPVETKVAAVDARNASVATAAKPAFVVTMKGDVPSANRAPAQAPAKPAEPIKTAKPAEPPKPATPAPTKAAEPVKTAKPAEPVKAAKPAEPVKTAKPAEPVKAAKPAEPPKAQTASMAPAAIAKYAATMSGARP